MRPCHYCKKEYPNDELYWTTDCQGIPFHKVCSECYDKVMAKGYDGILYTQADIDERIEDEE